MPRGDACQFLSMVRYRRRHQTGSNHHDVAIYNFARPTPTPRCKMAAVSRLCRAASALSSSLRTVPTLKRRTSYLLNFSQCHRFTTIPSFSTTIPTLSLTTIKPPSLITTTIITRRSLSTNVRKRPKSPDITRPIVIQRKPTTPSNRHTALIDKSGLYKGRPVGALTVGLRKRGGRCRVTGRITVRHRGGGNKRKLRILDFKRRAFSGILGTVDRIEYDPNRSSFIALIQYRERRTFLSDKTARDNAYILCPAGLRIGQVVESRMDGPVDIIVGNAMPLEHIPIGTIVHNVELKPGRGGQLCRAAGTSAQLLEKNGIKKFALLRLQSKERRLVPITCIATVGQVSNPEHKNQSFGKAGRMRWKGIRPSVRGVAMNPVDHPHGGGEGKTSGGRPSVSKWGMPTKGGYKTRSKRKNSKHIIKRRNEK